MVRIKICGITNHNDASIAVKLGVHGLGFIFAPSPRMIAPETAREIIHIIPPFVQTVGVFVNEEPAIIKELMDFCGLDLIQLHGDESPEICEELMPRAIKAFRLKDESGLEPVRHYAGKVRAVLFDTYSKGKRGGTGETFDWDLAVKGKELGAPIILAGGLTPSNIEEAISKVRPFAVDVNSGIEEHPGIKSPVLIKELMEKIRRMDMGGLLDD